MYAKLWTSLIIGSALCMGLPSSAEATCYATCELSIVDGCTEPEAPSDGVLSLSTGPLRVKVACEKCCSVTCDNDPGMTGCGGSTDGSSGGCYPLPEDEYELAITAVAPTSGASGSTPPQTAGAFAKDGSCDEAPVFRFDGALEPETHYRVTVENEYVDYAAVGFRTSPDWTDSGCDLAPGATGGGPCPSYLLLLFAAFVRGRRALRGRELGG